MEGGGGRGVNFDRFLYVTHGNTLKSSIFERYDGWEGG